MRESPDLNPWRESLAGLDNRDCLREFLTVSGKPILSLAQADESEVTHLVSTAIRKIRIPTAEGIEISRELILRMKTHYLARYRSKQDYLAGVYDLEWPDAQDEYMPVCLTGHAGVGKSTLMLDLARILQHEKLIDIGAGHDKVKLTPCWRISMGKGMTVGRALAKLIDGERLTAKRLRTDEIIDLCRKISYRDGVGLIIVDELQFLAQSANAKVAISSMLLELGKLGIPYVFVANHSACQKLVTLPEEVRDRLLSAPRIMLPSLRGSDYWITYLGEVQRVLGRTYCGSLVNDESSIFSLTAGLMRHVEQLFVGTYRDVWSQGRRSVTMSDLMAYFDSTANTHYRKRVEQSITEFSSDKMPTHDKSPFSQPTILAQVYIDLEKEKRDKKYAEEVLRQSLPVSERKALAVKEKSAQARQASKPKTAEKTKRPKPKTPAEHFAAYLAKGGRGINPPSK